MTQRTIFDGEFEKDQREKREAATFDGPKSERKKKEGMTEAEVKRKRMLALAKQLAFEHAQRHGEVTADDVGRKLIQLGHSADCLGNAAGSIFKGKIWIFTGKRIRSKRVTNHARELKVWRLKDDV